MCIIITHNWYMRTRKLFINCFYVKGTALGICATKFSHVLFVISAAIFLFARSFGSPTFRHVLPGNIVDTRNSIYFGNNLKHYIQLPVPKTFNRLIIVVPSKNK